jgi:hypothetical protein
LIKEKPLYKLAAELAKEEDKIKMRQLEELAEEKKKFQQKAKDMLKDCIQDFMKENSEIKALGWIQFTPYFNDGEECVFSIHQLGFTTKDLTEEELEDYKWFDDGPWIETGNRSDSDYMRKYIKDKGVTISLYDKVSKLYSQLIDLQAELQIVFGDHCKVIVTQTGVEIYEFEHE